MSINIHYRNSYKSFKQMATKQNNGTIECLYFTEQWIHISEHINLPIFGCEFESMDNAKG